MVNNGEKMPDSDYKVTAVGSIMCKKCKKWYIPTKGDISTKNPNSYYKTCMSCREYQSRKNLEFRMRNAGK